MGDRCEQNLVEGTILAQPKTIIELIDPLTRPFIKTNIFCLNSMTLSSKLVLTRIFFEVFSDDKNVFDVFIILQL